MSVCLLVSFLKIESLVFSDIVCDGSQPWYLVIDETRFSKEKFVSLDLGPTGLNQALNEVFCHFIEFGSFVFLEIA